MLTNEQIEQLYRFCKKHSVRYYDVQVELVDHLANAIEDKMITNPRLSFEEALTQVHKSFGIRGFAPLVAEKQKAVDRQSRKLLVRLLKEQFRWPKIALALTVFALSYSLSRLLPADYVDVALLMSIIVIMAIIAIAGYRLQRMEKKSGRQFLLLQYRNLLNCAFLPMNLVTIIHLIPTEHKSMIMVPGEPGYLIGSLLFTSFVVMAVATCHVFKHLKLTLKKNYPAVFQAA